MNYLTLENVSKSFGDKILFQNLDLHINRGDKVALVAQNGTGKTTLLRVIAGEEAGEGETHRILLARGVKTGYLRQQPAFNDDWTVLETVYAGDHPKLNAIRDYEIAMLRPDQPERLQAALSRMEELRAWDFEATIKEILSKLNIDHLDQKVGTLSGGQRKRLALAKLLIDDPEFLILDEPTNHLDLEMIEWLEEYLSQPRITLFMVTHDRWFLERVCNYIVELEGGEIYKYGGNYTEYLEKKAIRHQYEDAEKEKAQKMMKKELEWINRQPKARGTKAKARVDAFEDLKDRANKPLNRSEVEIPLKGTRLGSKIIEMNYVSKSYGERTLVKDFFYKFKKNERVGIVGRNGVGKSTFLGLMTKEIRPDSGTVVVGGTVQFGYYTQDGINLKEDQRVIDVITDIAEFIPLEKGMKMTASALLERFLFTKSQQQVYVSQLSGGEKRRLYLLTVLMQNPNFLILDEPTNDLDILTLNVLENYLMDFKGCVVIVTHDRFFMDKLVDHLFVFEGNGHIKDFNGNYLAYRDYIRERERELRREDRAAQEAEARRAEANAPKPDVPTLTREERKQIGRLESKIGKLETRKTELETAFADTTLSVERITEMGQELAAVKEQIEELEMEWLELAERA